MIIRNIYYILRHHNNLASVKLNTEYCKQNVKQINIDEQFTEIHNKIFNNKIHKHHAVKCEQRAINKGKSITCRILSSYCFFKKQQIYFS